jgi:hypothetical protein
MALQGVVGVSEPVPSMLAAIIWFSGIFSYTRNRMQHQEKTELLG